MEQIPYQSKKWDKCKQELLRIGYDFTKMPSIDSYMQELENSKKEQKDYCHYFGCLSLLYHECAIDFYLNNPDDPLVIENT